MLWICKFQAVWNFFLNFAEFSCFCLFSLFRNISDLSSLATLTLYNGIFRRIRNFSKMGHRKSKAAEYSSLSRLIVLWKIANGFDIKEYFLMIFEISFYSLILRIFYSCFLLNFIKPFILIFGGKPWANQTTTKITSKFLLDLQDFPFILFWWPKNSLQKMEMTLEESIQFFEKGIFGTYFQHTVRIH